MRSPAIRCFVMVQNALDEMVASHSQGGGCTCLTATGCLIALAHLLALDVISELGVLNASL